MIEEKLNIPAIGIIPFVPLELVVEDTLIDYEKRYNTHPQTEEEIERELDKLSSVIREHMDIDYIYKIMKLKG